MDHILVFYQPYRHSLIGNPTANHSRKLGQLAPKQRVVYCSMKRQCFQNWLAKKVHTSPVPKFGNLALCVWYHINSWDQWKMSTTMTLKFKNVCFHPSLLLTGLGPVFTCKVLKIYINLKTSGRRIGSTIVAILIKVPFQKKTMSWHSNKPHPPPHSTEQLNWLLLQQFVTSSNNQAPTPTSTWLFEEVLARSFAEKSSEAWVRTEGVMGKKGEHWQTDQWTDEVLINKKNGDKNTKVSCSWDWGSCKSEWGVNKQKVTNDSFCLPSRALDHTAGLGGERPRCGCPLTVGRKPSVTKIKKSEAWAKSTAKVHWEQFYKLSQNDPFTFSKHWNWMNVVLESLFSQFDKLCMGRFAKTMNCLNRKTV